MAMEQLMEQQVTGRCAQGVWVEHSFVLFSTTSTVTKYRSGERLSVHPSFRIENWTAAAAARLLYLGRWSGRAEFFKKR